MSTSSQRKPPKGLGRGLEVLLGPNIGDQSPADLNPLGAPQHEQVLNLPLAQLQPGQYQPRTRMDESALQELAQSIRAQGIMQPILVRPVGDQRYEIIAGERRFRASQLAGLDEVPVLVKRVPDEAAMAMALIENIQREDLNPLEEAQGVQRLVQEFNLTHEEAAQAIGRSRSATSNLLRLLNLVPHVQTMLLAGDLEMGHARALLALPGGDQVACANEVVNRRLSVREAEQLVARWGQEGAGQPPKKAAASADALHLQNRLADWLASPVQLKSGPKGKGELRIPFGSLDELEGVLQRIGFPLEGQ